MEARSNRIHLQNEKIVVNSIKMFFENKGEIDSGEKN